MADSSQRVAVDRVEWSQLVMFPRLARAFTVAVQPNRVLMGLAMIVVVMISGRLWDATAGPAVGPGGLGDALPQADALRAHLANIIEDDDLVEPGRRTELTADDRADPALIRAIVLERFANRSPDEAERYAQVTRDAVTSIDMVSPIGAFEACQRYIVGQFRNALEAVVGLHPGEAYRSLGRIPVVMPGLLWPDHKLFVIFFGLWFMVIFLIGGATISRSAVCEFSLNQFIPWTEALAFSLRRWMALCGTIVLPVAALLIGVLLLAVGGLLFRVPGGNVLGALLYGPALIGSFLAACILILGILGLSMYVPAVTAESADAADALARSFSYIKNRPLHFLFYIALAVAIGLLGLLVVTLFAVVTINIAAWGISLFAGADTVSYVAGAELGRIAPPGDHWELINVTDRLAAAVVDWWRTLVGGIVAGFVVSYLFTAQSIIYLLMRKATDDQDIQEIWIPGLIEATMAPSRTGDAAASSDATAKAD